MIAIETNINSVVETLKSKLSCFYSGGECHEGMMHSVAEVVLNKMKTRSHEDGLAADGTLIGRHPDGGRVLLVSTGSLRDELKTIKGSAGYGLGWSDTEKSVRAADLEKRYGKKIWSTT